MDFLDFVLFKYLDYFKPVVFLLLLDKLDMLAFLVTNPLHAYSTPLQNPPIFQTAIVHCHIFKTNHAVSK